MESLGIDLKIILVQIVNFGILVFVLNKFLYKPVLKAVKAKKEEYALIAKDKEEIAKEAEAMNSKRELIIKSAQKEKTDAVKEARLEAASLKKDALQKAQKEAKEIIEKAKKEIAAEKSKLNRAYDKDVLDAAFAVAEKVIGKSADKKEVEKAYKELNQLKRAVRNN